MPLMETVTIINKSGKVISTGKQLLNIFKDAKDAYNYKKAALHADHHARIQASNSHKLLRAREETCSQASSRHSSGSHRSRRRRHRDGEIDTSRPPLTERALSQISEGSHVSQRRSKSHHGPRRLRSPGSNAVYREPYPEDVDSEFQPELIRRHTDFSNGTSQAHPNQAVIRAKNHRSSSVPDINGHDDDNIDMNLAYGALPPDLQPHLSAAEREQELTASMSKLDKLLLEAHCLQHSATAIIGNLQSNPEAMAAVALTLAEISNLLTKMSPSIIGLLRSSSPAVFALLASPQFLIAGGVAIGVTVVMFGGFKIIKKIQADAEIKKEAGRMEEAMAYEGDLSSIDMWRRGIADVEAVSVATSVDGEFITPEAAKRKHERIKEREDEARSERVVPRNEGSVKAESKKEGQTRSSPSRVAASESGRSEHSRRESKEKEVVVKEKKSKKNSALGVLFKRSKERKERQRESTLSLRPKMIEM